MGVVLDLLSVEKDLIEKLRDHIEVYYQLEQEKNLWIRIYKEAVASPNKSVDQNRLKVLFSSKADLKLSLTLGKDWDVLHYLVSGTIEESDDIFSKVIIGGEKLFEDKDWSYGPPVLLSATETWAVAEALVNLPSAVVKARFQPEHIAELCYGVSRLDQDNQSFLHIFQHLDEDGYEPYWNRIKEVTHYYSLAASQGMGMLKSKS